MLIGVYQGAETSQNGIVENLENLIVDYLCHQHDKFKDKLKFSFTQQNLFNRLFDYFDSDKLQEVILSLLNSIPKKRNSNEIRQWYNSIREIVELVFKNPDGTIPRKIQYGLGKSYCYTIASSMPEGWDPENLPEETILSVYQLFLTTYCFSWQVNEADLADKLISSFMSSNVQATVKRTIEEKLEVMTDIDFQENTEWTRSVTRCFQSTSVEQPSKLNPYSFKDALAKNKFISTCSKEQVKERSQPENEDPIISEIVSLIHKFTSINFSPVFDLSDEYDFNEKFPPELCQQIRKFYLCYNLSSRKNQGINYLSLWMKETSKIIFEYLFDSDLSVNQSLHRSGLKNKHIEFYANEGKMNIEQVIHLIYSFYFIKFTQLCYTLVLKYPSSIFDLENQNPILINVNQWLNDLTNIFSQVGSFYLCFRYNEATMDYQFSIEDREGRAKILASNNLIIRDIHAQWPLVGHAVLRQHTTVLDNIVRVNPSVVINISMLGVAAEHGRTRVIAEYFKTSDLVHESLPSNESSEWTPLELSAKNGYLETVQYFVEELNATEINSAFHLAAANGHVETTRYLLGKVIVNNLWELTHPAYIAAANRQHTTVLSLLESTLNKKQLRINELIKRCASAGLTKTLGYLLTTHPNIRILNTVLQLSVRNLQQKNTEYLLANFNFEIDFLNELLCEICKRDTTDGSLIIIDRLLDAGADPKKVDISYLPNSVQLVFYNKTFDPTYQFPNGNYTLYDAILNLNIPLILKLIEKDNSIVNQRSKGELTALHASVRVENQVIAQFLIDQGADVNARTAHGNTPLMWSILNGSSNMIRCFLFNEADYLSKFSKKGYSAIDLVLALDEPIEFESRFKCFYDFLIFHNFYVDVNHFKLSPEANILLMRNLHRFQDIRALRVADLAPECRSGTNVFGSEVFSDFFKAFLNTLGKLNQLQVLEIENNELSEKQMNALFDIVSKKKNLQITFKNDNIPEQFKNILAQSSSGSQDPIVLDHENFSRPSPEEEIPKKRRSKSAELYEKFVKKLHKIHTLISKIHRFRWKRHEVYSPYKSQYSSIDELISLLNTSISKHYSLYKQLDSLTSEEKGKGKENVSGEGGIQSVFSDKLTDKVINLKTRADSFLGEKQFRREYQFLNAFSFKLEKTYDLSQAELKAKIDALPASIHQKLSNLSDKERTLSWSSPISRRDSMRTDFSPIASLRARLKKFAL